MVLLFTFRKEQVFQWFQTMGVRISLIIFPAHVTNFALLGLPCPTLIWGQVVNHFRLFILMTELIWSSPEPCLYLELCLLPSHAIYHDSRLSIFLSSMYFPQFQLYYFSALEGAYHFVLFIRITIFWTWLVHLISCVRISSFVLMPLLPPLF